MQLHTQSVNFHRYDWLSDFLWATQKNHKFKQVHQWTDACCRMVSWDPQKKVHQTGEINIDWPDCQMSLHSAKRWTRKALRNFFLHPSVFWHSRGITWAKVHQYWHWCTTRTRLPMCQISSPSDNLSMRYLLPNFVDFYESMTDKPTKK